MAIKKDVAGFIAVIFLLLGALFGMNIMTFIFGSLSSANSTAQFSPNETYVYNRTNAYINSSGYTVPEVSSTVNFRNFRVIEARNSTAKVITTQNYTVNSQTGKITGTGANWTGVQLDYYFEGDSASKIKSDEVQENSLEAIKTYSTGANTQMSVVSVVIVLALLLGLFGLFWKYFKDSKGNERVGNFA